MPRIVASSIHYLRLIETRLKIGTWALDLRTHQVAWSAGFERLLALEPGTEPSLDALMALADPGDRWIMDDLLRPGTPGEGEHVIRMVGGDGAAGWYGCWPETLADDRGEAAIRLFAIRDVTRRSHHLDRLVRHDLIFQTLAGLGDDLVWLLDARGDPRRPGSWTRRTGQSYGDLRRHGWTGAVHPEERQAAAEAWADAQARTGPFEGVFRCLDADGGFVALHLRVVPVVHEDGRLLEWVGRGSPVASAPVARPAAPRPTPSQLRASRGLLDWTVGRLAAASQVSAATIARYERNGDIRPTTLDKLRRTIEAAGVEFVDSSSGGLAIRLREP